MRDGVLFVATGAGYRQLAARAAASVARVSPGLPIDLATDEPVEPGDFATVTLLDDPWFRSRIDAMAATRFERTLHLDADVLAVADLRDVFEVLDRFDIALAHDQARNSPAANAVWRRPLPAAFPQFNGGVIAYRRTPEVLGFLAPLGRGDARARHEEGPAVAARAALGERPQDRHAAARVQPPRPRRRPALGPLPPGAAADPPLPLPQAFHRRPPRGGERRGPARADDRGAPADDARRRPRPRPHGGARAARADASATALAAFAAGLAGLPRWAAARVGFALRRLAGRR